MIEVKKLFLSSRLTSWSRNFLTVLKCCVNQILGALEQLLPVLLHHQLDLHPSAKAELVHPPVMGGGPPAAVDKGKAEKKDEEVE